MFGSLALQEKQLIVQVVLSCPIYLLSRLFELVAKFFCLTSYTQ